MKRIIVVSALWCPSCLLLKKELKQLKKDYSALEIVALDYDFDEEEVVKYKVKNTLPVIIVEEDNHEINRLIGEQSYDQIIDFLKGSDVI